MADFSVLIYTLENKSSKLNAYKGRLESYASKVLSVSNIPIKGDAGDQIRKLLKTSANDILEFKKTADVLSTTIKSIGDRYLNAEIGGISCTNNKSVSFDISLLITTISKYSITGGSLRKLIFDEKNRVTEYEIDSIAFSDSGVSNNKFDVGGNQNISCNSYLKNREEIKNIIKKNMSDTDIPNDIDFDKYLEKLNSEGCVYTALANSIMAYYIGKEDEFEKDFGYKMFIEDSSDPNDGKINYNMLIADIYSSIDNRKNGKYNKYVDYDKNYDGAKKNYNHWEDKSGYGTNIDIVKKEYETFLSKRNLKVKINKNYGKIIDAQTLKKCTDSGETLIISRHGGGMYNDVDATQKAGDLYDQQSGEFEGHEMVIIGVAENGNYIVSSWGKKYYLKPDEFHSSNIYSVKYTSK
ncbi:MAG: hypothetical protein ACLUO6_07295 [Ruminococcus sp.]